VLGIVIGGLAGYYGGWVDMVVQRIIEVLQSLPSDAALDGAGGDHAGHLEPALIYFGITIILRPARLDRAGARRALEAAGPARGGLSARRPADGRQPRRIIGRHLMPSFMSHLIARHAAIPGMILGETALSFLGLGLRPPITSWGMLLTEARSVSVIAFYPWLLLPMIPVIGHPRLQLPRRRPARRGGSLSMSRLDSFIRRLTAQRDILNHVCAAVAAMDGPVLELGLGNGRTFNHLREKLPGRRIIAFDRALAAHAQLDPTARGSRVGRNPRHGRALCGLRCCAGPCRYRHRL
jgi:hypothetical protein